jgi:hypothetical protein
MKTSIATVSMSGDPREMPCDRGCGVDGVEIFENDCLAFGGTRCVPYSSGSVVNISG